jgi:hypothetical protein
VRIPVVGVRVGGDAVVGLVPVIGDVVGGLMTLYIIGAAIRYRVPPAVVVRMLLRTAIDLAVGSIPFVGDAFDVFYRDKLANVRLLLQHRSR